MSEFSVKPSDIIDKPNGGASGSTDAEIFSGRTITFRPRPPQKPFLYLLSWRISFLLSQNGGSPNLQNLRRASMSLTFKHTTCLHLLDNVHTRTSLNIIFCKYKLLKSPKICIYMYNNLCFRMKIFGRWSPSAGIKRKRSCEMVSDLERELVQ